MNPRTIAIGDIHGHLQSLDGLIAAIAPTENDTLIFLGDYIDRGPDSKGVIERILELQGHCKVVSLLGNHEEMLLDALSNERSLHCWLENGGDAALDSYGSGRDISCIPATHRDFLNQLVMYYETETHFFVHANYAPNWPLAQHDSRTALWLPLTEIPAPHYSGRIAVVGHTPQPAGKILDAGHLICIDTGCGFGGCLTALEVSTEKTWQCSERGTMI